MGLRNLFLPRGLVWYVLGINQPRLPNYQHAVFNSPEESSRLVIVNARRIAVEIGSWSKADYDACYGRHAIPAASSKTSCICDWLANIDSGKHLVNPKKLSKTDKIRIYTTEQIRRKTHNGITSISDAIDILIPEFG